jgi:hypothetical protein
MAPDALLKPTRIKCFETYSQRRVFTYRNSVDTTFSVTLELFLDGDWKCFPITRGHLGALRQHNPNKNVRIKPGSSNQTRGDGQKLHGSSVALPLDCRLTLAEWLRSSVPQEACVQTQL